MVHDFFIKTGLRVVHSLSITTSKSTSCWDGVWQTFLFVVPIDYVAQSSLDLKEVILCMVPSL